MMLGFSLAAKPKRGKVSVQVEKEAEQRQLITGIEGSRIKAADAQGPVAGPRVIPSIGNTYRAGVGKGGAGTFVPSFVPPSSEDALATSNQEKFVAAPQDDGTKPVVKQYGLQRMDAVAAAGGSSADAAGPATAAAAAEGARPLVARRNEKQQFMEELDELPDEMAPEVRGGGCFGGTEGDGGPLGGGDLRS